MPRTLIHINSPTLGQPRWAGDYRDRDHLIPGGAKIDASQFRFASAVVVVVGAAGAAANAVAVPVDALLGPIPDNTLLDFGGKKFARLSAAAAAGAVSLDVDALATALVDNDTAVYNGLDPQKVIPSGTIIGRTIAERDAGTGFGPAADADDEIYIAAFDITDADEVDDVELYRPNSVVYENFLPGWASASVAVKAAVRDKYVCSIGQV